MTEFLGLPLPFLLLFPLALAAGVDLFLTLLVVLASMELGWTTLQAGGTPSLRWGVMAMLALLYLVEWGMELRPLRGLVWHNLQLALRPLGAFLLALTLLDGAPTLPLFLGATAAAVVAAFSHVLAWGGKLQRFLLPSPSLSPITHALAEDTLVLALLVLAFEQPGIAFPLSGGILLAGLMAGGPFHHLTRFGTALLRDSVWGIVEPVRWLEEGELPKWIQRWSQGQDFTGVRGLRAGMKGLPKAQRFRDGWLLEAGPVRFLAYRRLRGAVFTSLAGFHLFPQPPSALAQTTRLEAPDGSRSALFLHRGAPGPKPHKW
jgi:hypothetical protein